ncbi:UNVERIFIED_CONTAM: hypothetical protein Sradi_3981800 [Sesamum radiatum]|uniref:Retrotransposon Copia-like N-terminal domain-containing protein n=1 Tax=Sesamum radiatum TaxID=300843 RepID=A0AAW2PI03_SESRA
MSARTPLAPLPASPRLCLLSCRALRHTAGPPLSCNPGKTTLGATVKLNGQNYILWSQAFRLFLSSQNKLNHILTSPPPSTDATFSAWPQTDYSVMTWLLNSMEEYVSTNVMFLTTAMAMWDTLHDMYSHEKEISRVFEPYEKLFSLKKDGRSVSDCDAQTQKTQWEDFSVAKFLSGLDNNLRMVRDHLLANDSVPTLSNDLSRVLRVATGSSKSSSSSGTTIKSSAMAMQALLPAVGVEVVAPPTLLTLATAPIVVEAIMSAKNVGSNMLLHRLIANSDTPATASFPSAFVASHASADTENDWWRL